MKFIDSRYMGKDCTDKYIPYDIQRISGTQNTHRTKYLYRESYGIIAGFINNI
jgi:hypothetical protein